MVGVLGLLGINVSTHSRLKAAGLIKRSIRFVSVCFNTQPPEGGWICAVARR